jgi:DNA-binding Lrp family transcriptional regulator
LLAIAQGVPIARLARAVKVTRPTVYRYIRAWQRSGCLTGLRADVAGQLADDVVVTTSPEPPTEAGEATPA